MNYNINLSDDKRFLIMKAVGDFTIDIARQWSVEIAKRGRELNIRRFLFVVRLARNACTVLENYNHAYRDPDDLRLLKNIRSAILISEADRSHDFVEITLKTPASMLRYVLMNHPQCNGWKEKAANQQLHKDRENHAVCEPQC